MPMERGESEEEGGERVSRFSLPAVRVSLLTEHSWGYSGCGELLGADWSLAEENWVLAAEVEDGAGLGEGGGAGVDEEGDAAVKLIEDGCGGGAGGLAAAVGAGGGEGADATGEGAQKRVRGQADADGVAAGGEGWRQVAARGEYEGERAGPVTVDEGLGPEIVPTSSAYNGVCLLSVAQQYGQRFPAWALFDCEEPVDGGGITVETDQAVNGIGGDADDGAPLHGGFCLVERVGLVSRDHDCHRFCSATDGRFRCAGFCEPDVFALLQCAAQ